MISTTPLRCEFAQHRQSEESGNGTLNFLDAFSQSLRQLRRAGLAEAAEILFAGYHQHQLSTHIPRTFQRIAANLEHRLPERFSGIRRVILTCLLQQLRNHVRRVP